MDCQNLEAWTEIRLHTEIQPTLHEILSQSSIKKAAAKTSKAWEAGVSHLYLRRLRQEDCQKFEVNLVYTVRFTPAWAKPAYQYIHIYNLSTEGSRGRSSLTVKVSLVYTVSPMPASTTQTNLVSKQTNKQTA